jgi:hypothetical protein
LAWEIWKEPRGAGMPVETLGVIIGLVLTFVLSTVSGFMLGGNQAPAGQGLPIVGWHFYKDIRPAHFLGVHAQQLTCCSLCRTGFKAVSVCLNDLGR